jgi:hypothetical protein
LVEGEEAGWNSEKHSTKVQFSFHLKKTVTKLNEDSSVVSKQWSGLQFGLQSPFPY